jgi:hypothetical protein
MNKLNESWTREDQSRKGRRSYTNVCEEVRCAKVIFMNAHYVCMMHVNIVNSCAYLCYSYFSVYYTVTLLAAIGIF